MNTKQAQLAQRHAALVNRIAEQRNQLSVAMEPFQAPLSLVDKGVMVYRFLAHKPLLMGGIAALVAATHPKRWLFVLENGFMIWQLFSAARRKINSNANERLR
jgi:hypothetical protein